MSDTLQNFLRWSILIRLLLRWWEPPKRLVPLWDTIFSLNTADVMPATYLKMWKTSVRPSRRSLKKWFCFQKKHEEKRISKSKGRLVPCTQYPCECCPFVKTFSYICRVTRFCRLTLHIVKVFFRKSLNENVVVFNAKRRYGTTLTSCRFVRIGAFCALIPHIYYGVGYCVVYFSMGLTTTFI